MENDGGSTRSNTEAKELLLADYRYFAECFWKNEQTGEARVNFFVGIATLVVGALAALLTKGPPPSGEPLRLVVLISLFSLLVLGLITMMRMLTRNENTDGYKQSMDTVRQTFKDHFDGDGILLHYHPFGVLRRKERSKRSNKDNEEGSAPGTVSGLEKWWTEYKNEIQPRNFGGLAHTVAAINSLILAGLVAVAVYPIPVEGSGLARVYGSATPCFLLGFGAQLMYVAYRETRARDRLRAGTYTHAGGVVYKLKDGITYYLLVRPKENKDEWVFPKGHIEQGEGHDEAALREVHEETGVIGRLICPVASMAFKTKKEDVYGKFYLMECLYEGDAREARVREWFPLEKALGALTFANAKHVLRESERARVALASSQTPK